MLWLKKPLKTLGFLADLSLASQISHLMSNRLIDESKLESPNWMGVN